MALFTMAGEVWRSKREGERGKREKKIVEAGITLGEERPQVRDAIYKNIFYF